jgi:hypothetical protein
MRVLLMGQFYSPSRQTAKEAKRQKGKEKKEGGTWAGRRGWPYAHDPARSLDLA